MNHWFKNLLVKILLHIPAYQNYATLKMKVIFLEKDIHKLCKNIIELKSHPKFKIGSNILFKLHDKDSEVSKGEIVNQTIAFNKDGNLIYLYEVKIKNDAFIYPIDEDLIIMEEIYYNTNF